MKKLLLLLIVLLLSGCNIPAPKQVTPSLYDYILPIYTTEDGTSSWELEDIPLTNMPGHALPECPLECLCPNWFGLEHSPCDTNVCQSMEEHHEVTTVYSLDEGAMKAAKEDKLLLIVLLDKVWDYTANSNGVGNSVLNSHSLVGLLYGDPCMIEELNKHYVVVEVNEEEYKYTRMSSESRMAWTPGDYIQKPSIAFAKVELAPSPYDYRGYTLPISYTGNMTNIDLCTTLKGFYAATR